MANDDKDHFGGEFAPKDMVAVGRVESNRARLWVRSEHTGQLRVDVREAGSPDAVSQTHVVREGNPEDNTLAFWFPQDPENQLKPLTHYEFSVVRTADGKTLGNGRFETAPASPDETPSTFAFAIMSCHQPFANSGCLEETAMRMWAVLDDTLKQHGVKFVIFTGDQIYSDYPATRSLRDRHFVEKHLNYDIHDWPPEEVRSAFQQRYRIFWSMEEVQRIQANYPGYYIFDDHEVVDDWGTDGMNDPLSPFTDFRTGALQAYCDYQASRVGEATAAGPFDYAFEYGSAAFFVFDLRSERGTDPRHPLYSPEQFDRFRRFLDDNGDKRALFIVASVPILHLAGWLADVGGFLFPATDARDHWSYGPNVATRNRFLRTLHKHQKKHPSQRIAFLSGDVHISAAFKIEWDSPDAGALYQLTSSAVSNQLKGANAQLSTWAADTAHRMPLRLGKVSGKVRLIPGEEEENNPFNGLNVGIVEVRDEGDDSSLLYRIVAYSEDHKEPEVKWTSDILK